MKKIISTVLVCALLVCTLFTLASCSKKISGIYEREDSLFGVTVATTTYVFEANGKVTIKIDPVVGDDTIQEGEYEFNKEGDKITFYFENEDGEVNAKTVPFVEGSEGDVKYIKLDGVQYDKVD